MKTKLLFLLLFTISFYSFAQKHTLTGTIYDEDKNGLAYAEILIKNSAKGVITNEKGQFSIEVNKKDILEVSYLGFETKEIEVTTQKNISITLETSREVMDAVEIIAYSSTCRISRITCTLFSYKGGCGIETHSEEKEASEFKRIQGEERLYSLFPNPSSSGLFQLQLNTNYTKLNVKVFTMNGQLIQSNTHINLTKIPQIDLSKQPKGIYLIRITADGNVLETKKAVRS